MMKELGYHIKASRINHWVEILEWVLQKPGEPAKIIQQR